MDAFTLCRTLVRACPVPVETRDWDALPPEGRVAWIRYSGEILKAQAEEREADFRREMAEALSPARPPGGLDDEDRVSVLAAAFARYARHRDDCAQAPCSCGLAALLEP
jgi:hypothetical protein